MTIEVYIFPLSGKLFSGCIKINQVSRLIKMRGNVNKRQATAFGVILLIHILIYKSLNNRLIGET